MSGRRPGVRGVSAAHPGTPGSPRRPAALASWWRLGARPAGEGWAWGGSGAGSPESERALPREGRGPVYCHVNT